jgi:hypothetical protein
MRGEATVYARLAPLSQGASLRQHGVLKQKPDSCPAFYLLLKLYIATQSYLSLRQLPLFSLTKFYD